MIKRYFKNLLIGIDQLANTIMAGDPDETISSRAGKKVKAGKTGPWKWLCLVLNKFDENHCQESIEEDEGKDTVI